MGARPASSPSAPAVRRFSFVLASRVAFRIYESDKFKIKFMVHYYRHES